MAAGIDVRVDADGHAGPGAPGGRQVSDARQLAGRLDVDRRQAEADRPVELGRRLAHAGEDDLVGPESGAQGDFDLAG